MRPVSDLSSLSGASVVVVGLFVLAITALGSSFYDSGFTDQGAFMLVGAIAAFVVVMSVVGYLVKR